MDIHCSALRAYLIAATVAITAALAACGGGADRPAAASNATASEASPLKKALAVPVGAPSLETLTGATPVDPSGTEDGRQVALKDYVQDRAAAIRLGKALFWDTNLGSDGKTACASCHFQAGADNRIKNQISPTLLNTNPALAGHFNKPALSKSWGPNYTLGLADFPLHVLSDALDRNSTIVSTTDNVIGSQGVFDKLFVTAGQSRFDDCTKQADSLFNVGGLNTRRVTGRNSPTVINAAFNVRNFWDGRANNIFNGFSPFGNRDPDAAIWVTTATDNTVVKARMALADASAASQAVGPPTSDFEMSCGGRTFPNIARRVLDMPSLVGQSIDPNDSVLASFAGGVKPAYRQMIQAAFHPRLWNGTTAVNLGGMQFSQIEANFPLFFGLAIQLYESTLVSDQAPLDRYLQGDTSALGAAEVRGMQLFTGAAKCVNCHNGPELTGAATRLRLAPTERVERMLMGDGQAALYDNGFYNIGVRPTFEDVGVGGKDPWNNPLSFTRQYRILLNGGNPPDPFQVDPCKFAVLVDPKKCSTPPSPDFRDAVDGAFKVPTLRNIALTGPYFHNGSRATLEQVVEFYNRGGDRRGSDASNTSGFGPNPSNLDPDIKRLNLSAQDQSDIVSFLRNALTDPRVAWQRAPFDHPSLRITDGHIGDEISVAGSQATDSVIVKQAQDQTIYLPAVGKDGRALQDGPLQPFVSRLK